MSRTPLAQLEALKAAMKHRDGVVILPQVRSRRSMKALGLICEDKGVRDASVRAEIQETVRAKTAQALDLLGNESLEQAEDMLMSAILNLQLLKATRWYITDRGRQAVRQSRTQGK